MTLDARKINTTYEDKFSLNYVHKCTMLIRVYVDDMEDKVVTCIIFGGSMNPAIMLLLVSACCALKYDKSIISNECSLSLSLSLCSGFWSIHELHGAAAIATKPSTPRRVSVLEGF